MTEFNYPLSRGINTTGTTITYGNIPDGNFLKRQGTEIVGDPSSSSDQLVKATATDTTADYLRNKVRESAGISLVIINPAGDEEIQITMTGTYGFTGLQRITVSASAPGSPAVNDLWIDTS